MDLGSPGPDVQVAGKPWKLKKGAEITSPPCARSRERKREWQGYKFTKPTLRKVLLLVRFWA